MNLKFFKPFNIMLFKLPSPINISIWWNFGSLLGVCLLTQIISGLFLSMHYCPNSMLSFYSIIHISQDINYGSIMRIMHSNGASIFFLCLYIHIYRGLYYNSFKLTMTWLIGVLILLLTMMTAFMGYVLPWGQMSFWGATVITNLLSSIPYIGNMITYWIWGGYSVNSPTLNRFFSFHFIMPFLIIFMVMIHLFFLHMTGSNNPMGLNSNLYKIPFHVYFTMKDIIGFIFLFLILMLISYIYPFILSDPDNFSPANSFITPSHIKPEWYFLFAYAILRSIPNKLGGVIALLMSILIIMILPFSMNNMIQSMKFNFLNQIYFWMIFNSTIILTWIGMNQIEPPFIIIGQILTIIYFSYFLINPLIYTLWNKILYI
uniref:Cytochrome b n=1 Tax=Pelecinus polyturator TaxID=44352 RepID=A0A0E3EL51_9HYME|nr:cytochrome b [Pelecinus polyturator]AIW82476.1 cytochrome b [Pelecinus polyturator]